MDAQMSEAHAGLPQGSIGTSLIDGNCISSVLSHLSRGSEQLGLAAQQASLLLSSARIERGTLDLLFNSVLQEGRSTNRRLSTLEDSVKELANGVNELTRELRKIASTE